MLIRLKSSSQELVVIGSISMSICNCFHGRLANNGKITTFMRYRYLMPSCAGFLEPRNLRLRPLKSTFNAKNLFWSISSEFGVKQFALEMRLAAPNRQKIHKPLFWRSRSSKVIEFGGNQEPVYDFLLVINSNPISHRYWDTATYWLKIANFKFFPPPLILRPCSRWSLRIYGKTSRFLKLESSRSRR